MKKIVLCAVALSMLASLTACGLTGGSSVDPNHLTGDLISMLVEYITFDEALLWSTDVVIAQYEGQRHLGEELLEFEFVVLERVLGNAADRIFVYVMNADASTIGHTTRISYNTGDLSFSKGTQYLLALESLSAPHRRIHEDGYVFIKNLVIDLGNLANSTIYNEPLSLHSTELDFSRGSLSREQIVAHVRETTVNNLPARKFIKSDNITNIIAESPYILVVEVNELHSMARTDLQHTDIFYCTVLQTIKGDIGSGFELAMVFLADTVQPGEQHVIAVLPVEEGSDMFVFSSRNSLFRMDQLDEILKLIADADEVGDRPESDTIETDAVEDGSELLEADDPATADIIGSEPSEAADVEPDADTDSGRSD